jgi:hypothetical protein
MKQHHQSNRKSARETTAVSLNVVDGLSTPPGTHEEISVLAHGLWQARGCPEGSPDQDWFQASQEFQTHD